MKKKEKKPVGIWIISVFYFIAVVLYFLTGLISLFYKELLYNIPKLKELSLANGVFIFFGLFMFGLAILSFFIARGILKRQNWARTTVIVISIINIVGGILSIAEGSYISSINLLANLVIGIYLIFSEKVKKFFKNA